MSNVQAVFTCSGDECSVCLVAGVLVPLVVDGASRGTAAEVEEPLGCCDAEAGMANGAPDAAAFPAMAMGV